MTISQTIDNAVDTVFAALSSLVKTGQLQGQSVEDFDFQTGSVQSTAVSDSIQFLVLTNKLLEDGTIEKSLLFKTKELDPSLYSSLVFEGKTYRFEKIEIFEAATIITVKER